MEYFLLFSENSENRSFGGKREKRVREVSYTDKRECPIGVFDSGVGGISVLRELEALMPNENYIYYGDSKHAPYGTKTLEEVQRLTLADAAFLAERHVKALVVACNTATSAAVGLLREKYADMPVIGIEPALKPAMSVKAHPRVLVLATPMTLREEKFRQLMKRYEAKGEIFTLPAPGLVELVEQGELAGNKLEGYLRELFGGYLDDKPDCVVLGCTHYPFVRKTVQQVFGKNVMIFDGGAGTARETKRRLAEAGLLNPGTKRGIVTLLSSSEEEETVALERMLFEKY